MLKIPQTLSFKNSVSAFIVGQNSQFHIQNYCHIDIFWAFAKRLQDNSAEIVGEADSSLSDVGKEGDLSSVEVLRWEKYLKQVFEVGKRLY